MSSKSSSPEFSPPLLSTHPVQFVIVGGGIAGLSAAVALQRVGHRCLVLEGNDLAGSRGNGGIRLPPNLTKILFHWGLKDILTEQATVARLMHYCRYETGELLGNQEWNKDTLRDTGGTYMMSTHDELHRVLYDAAVQHGAQIRHRAKVVDIDVEHREVILESGERINGDVIVGADGEAGVARRVFLGGPQPGRLIGTALYHSIMKIEDMRGSNSASDDLLELQAVVHSIGDRRVVVCFAVYGKKGWSLQFYGPDDVEGTWSDKPSVRVTDIVKENFSEAHRRLMVNAPDAVRVSVREFDDLEDWVSEDGPLVLIGEAAHPFPAGAIQCAAMAVEDGAVLGKLFSHLSSARQIPSLLYAFQEVRQPRTREVRQRDARDLAYMLLPNGHEQAARDARMQALTRMGKNVLDELDDEEEGHELWETLCRTFGYDCEDEADGWWVQWGMLRERAALERDRVASAGRDAEALEDKEEGASTNGMQKADFSGLLSVQVTESTENTSDP